MCNLYIQFRGHVYCLFKNLLLYIVGSGFMYHMIEFLKTLKPKDSEHEKGDPYTYKHIVY